VLVVYGVAYSVICDGVGGPPTGVLNWKLYGTRVYVVASDCPHASLNPTLNACAPVMYDALRR
jgi:hypothetical protein